MRREYLSWWSDRLQRTMELLIFGESGAKVLVFPTRCARFHEYEDLRMTEILRDKISSGCLQLFCVDSVDHESFYCTHTHPAERIRRHMAYEQYIVHEVMPFMQVRNPHPCVIAHGCSLGAFHAVNIAMRIPCLFKKVVAFSGRYDLTITIDHYRDLFDGFYSEDIYFNTPTHFLPNLSCERQLQHLRALHIILTVGEQDVFRGNNEHLSRILHGKGIGHEFHLWHGTAHQGHDWRQMARLYV